MAIIKQHDKRSGMTYAYESHSYWDPHKKMTRAKRKLIGRVDPENGDISRTDGRNRKKSEKQLKHPNRIIRSSTKNFCVNMKHRRRLSPLSKNS